MLRGGDRMLTNRRIQILKAIVEEFIENAEPVGSKTLMQKYGLPYSSATIRNEMQYLEENGYLEKTHTSSGRVPSSLGYRFYCENLLESRVDERMELVLNQMVFNDSMDVEQVIQKSCNVLSEMTNLTSGVLGPDSSTQTLERIKLFPLSDRSAVCVFITNTGHTETKNFHFDDIISVEDIEKCCDILNDRLRGTSIKELSNKMVLIKPILAQHVIRHEMLFKAFIQAFTRFASESMYVSGAKNMLYQPEFADLEKLKKLMSYLEDASAWRTFQDKKHIQLSLLNRQTELVWLEEDNLAVVKSNFSINDGEQGQLMIVGPQRMNYEKIVSMLDYTASMIEKIYGGNNGRK